MNITFRPRDVVRFRRGSNEYLGEIIKVSSVLTALIVREQEGGHTWRVGHSHVVALEVPVVTEKECVALLALKAQMRQEATIAVLREQNIQVNATSMRHLADRGFVVATNEGVSASAPSVWRLTEEGRRVAQSL